MYSLLTRDPIVLRRSPRVAVFPILQKNLLLFSLSRYFLLGLHPMSRTIDNLENTFFLRVLIDALEVRFGGRGLTPSFYGVRLIVG
jgi:hypothetical protein